MPTPNQILERNDLQRCLSQHRDIGHFHWLPDSAALDPDGVEFVQFELGKLHQEFGDRLIPCLLTHDPTRPRDPHAMQVRTVEYVIGFVPDREAAWWQMQFDALQDPDGRLVGLCRIVREDRGGLAYFRPQCQFRVHQHSTRIA